MFRAFALRAGLMEAKVGFTERNFKQGAENV
jgi:hypothetical protein